jgi:uncharacterized protein (DUF2267 family)
VDDLAMRLPFELREALKRGRDRSGDADKRMSLDAFVRRLARREDVAVVRAIDDARAVFATLHEALGDQEFLDVTVALPAEYRRAARRRSERDAPPWRPSVFWGTRALVAASLLRRIGSP